MLGVFLQVGPVQIELYKAASNSDTVWMFSLAVGLVPFAGLMVFLLTHDKVYEGIPILMAWQSIPAAGKAIHR